MKSPRKRARSRLEHEAYAEIAKDKGQERERKQDLFLHGKIRVEFGQYLVGAVYVLPRDEPAVAALEMAVVHPFGRNLACKRIGRTSLARNDDKHLAPVLA